MSITRALTALAGLVVLIGWSSSVALAQSGEAPAPGKMSEEVYKNVQVLKGIPADLLPPTMQFVASSLGQRCTFCHVRDAFEKDDKKEKQTARRMMQMVLAINKDNFEGRTQVTCFTCHRGNQSPVSIPILPAAEPPREREEGDKQEAQRPTAEQLLDKYLAAMGGADALSRISSRAATGSVVATEGPQIAVQLYAIGTDRRVLITHSAQGDTVTAYSGDTGWSSNPERGLHDMSSFELEGAKLENDLYLATQARQIYTQWRVGRSEKIGDVDAYVLNGSEEGHEPLRLYFDPQSGLLLRLIHYTVTPLGRLPAQVDFADYRDQDGIKVPYRMTMMQRGSSITVQFDQVRQNVPVEDSKFLKPAATGRP